MAADLKQQIIEMLASYNDPANQTGVKYEFILDQLKTNSTYLQTVVKFVYSDKISPELRENVADAKMFLSRIPEAQKEIENFVKQQQQKANQPTNAEIATRVMNSSVTQSVNVPPAKTKTADNDNADVYHRVVARQRDEDIDKNKLQVIQLLANCEKVTADERLSVIDKMKEDKFGYNHYLLRIVNLYVPKNNQEQNLLNAARRFIEEQSKTIPKLQEAQTKFNQGYTKGTTIGLFSDKLPAEVSAHLASWLGIKEAGNMAKTRKAASDIGKDIVGGDMPETLRSNKRSPK